MSARRSGETAMRYARAWCARVWPEAAVHEAKPSRGRFVRSHDVWGVFDLVLAPPGLPVIGIQVTTVSPPNKTAPNGEYSSVRLRKRKVAAWMRKHQPSVSAHVVAYVRNDCLRIWDYSPASDKWHEAHPISLRALT